ncbi:PIG-L family deacetylase [Streptacidiphilus jiangxiensis]|uniref:GlcNAc-PI de-N-acetylase n=1 Tax=Streptacidiphilus jiangxiensis TaxID=235985 RepID=A0A1H7XT86_STRJI|nr:PIG-L family deacetylase [Streptacidiphilus jiangxiensis]SEM36209.1 GlcNAc-PI de-N-acetylase [Streptacidiphilus jiangxiensis]
MAEGITSRLAGGLTRRRALWLGGGAATATVLGISARELFQGVSAGSPHPGGGMSPGVVSPIGQSTGTSFVHVIAHADDSLYFHDPELALAMKSGHPCVVVCLTSGESDGYNGLEGNEAGSKNPPHPPGPRNRPAYARARMNALRRAMALIATGDLQSPWVIEAGELVAGHQVEVNTLEAAPNVKLYWLQLRENRTIGNPVPDSLRGLYLGATQTLETIQPEESPVQGPYQYSRQQVVDSLKAVFRLYRPSVVRTLDTNPIHKFNQPPNFGNGKQPPVPQLQLPVYTDHADHVYSALFAHQALEEYWAENQQTRVCLVETYRGYVNEFMPWNLGPAILGPKRQALQIYAGMGVPAGSCTDQAGCADRKLSAWDVTQRWARSTRYVAPGASDWVARLSDGRLAAFALLSGTAVQWVQRKAGEDGWAGPTPVGGSGLSGQISAVQLPDGKLALFTVRMVLDADPHRTTREVVSAVQTSAPGQPLTFGGWESLGCPDTDPVQAMEMGFPAVTVDSGANTHVFVRNFAGGVSVRTRSGDDAWQPWADLSANLPSFGLIGVQDGLAAVATPDGLVHVFAPSSKTLAHWASPTPGALPRPAVAVGLPLSSGPINGEALADGTIRLLYREPSSARIVVAELPPKAAAWRVTDKVPDAGGYGLVVGRQTGPVGAPTGVALVTRNDDGGVAAGTAAATALPKAWQSDEAFVMHVPGLAVDAKGRAVAVALHSDGGLHLARQTSTAPDAPFTDWAPASSGALGGGTPAGAATREPA